jgi:hypothetical protein
MSITWSSSCRLEDRRCSGHQDQTRRATDRDSGTKVYARARQRYTFRIPRNAKDRLFPGSMEENDNGTPTMKENKALDNDIVV